MDWTICTLLMSFISIIFLACIVSELIKIRRAVTTWTDHPMAKERGGDGDEAAGTK